MIRGYELLDLLLFDSRIIIFISNQLGNNTGQAGIFVGWIYKPWFPEIYIRFFFKRYWIIKNDDN